MKKSFFGVLCLLSSSSLLEARGGITAIEQELQEGKTLSLRIACKKAKADGLTENPAHPHLASLAAHYQKQADALHVMGNLHLTPFEASYLDAICDYNCAKSDIKAAKERLRGVPEFEKFQSLSAHIKQVRDMYEIYKFVAFEKNVIDRVAIDSGTPVISPRCDLGYAKDARSDQYGLNLPTAPVLHPYHPLDESIEKGFTGPAYTLNYKLPGYLSSFVPPQLHAHLKDFPPENIEFFLVVQDMPWQGVPLLLRPQSWLDPKAPFKSDEPYQQSFPVRTGLFSWTPHGPLLVGQPEGELIQETLTTHNSSDAATGQVSNPLIVSSGDSLIINGLDLNTSQSVFSLTIHGNRPGVGKHVALNQQDRALFERILWDSPDLATLEQALLREKNNFTWDALADQFSF